MFLYFTAKIFFLFLIELKEQTKAIDMENDITNPLNAWFASIFEIKASETEELVDGVTMKRRDLSNFKLGDESIHFHDQSPEGESSPVQIDFTSSANKIRVFYKKLELHVDGYIEDIGFDFVARHNIENACFTFTALAPNTLDREPNHMKISQDFTYSGTSTKIEITNSDTSRSQIDEVKEKFERKGHLFLLRVHFYDSLKVFRCLNEVFQSAIQRKNQLFSKYPNLRNSPEKFYYSIAEIPFFCFALKRIHIKGLSNLNTFTIGEPSPIFTHTLLIKNIEGNMTLDYGSGNESPLEMNFKIDHLFLLKDGKTNCGSVQAQYWQITRAKTNTLLDSRHSQVMIDALQSAIASSLLRSMDVWKVCTERLPQKIKITNTSDWESIKNSYKEWVPFNDDTH